MLAVWCLKSLQISEVLNSEISALCKDNPLLCSLHIQMHNVSTILYLTKAKVHSPPPAWHVAMCAITVICLNLHCPPKTPRSTTVVLIICCHTHTVWFDCETTSCTASKPTLMACKQSQLQWQTVAASRQSHLPVTYKGTLTHPQQCCLQSTKLLLLTFWRHLGLWHY